jgi:hypothetical protein
MISKNFKKQCIVFSGHDSVDWGCDVGKKTKLLPYINIFNIFAPG